MLAELYREVDEPELRLRVIDVIGPRGDVRSKQWTADVAASDPQPWARQRAQSWIEKQRGKR